MLGLYATWLRKRCCVEICLGLLCRDSVFLRACFVSTMVLLLYRVRKYGVCQYQALAEYLVLRSKSGRPEKERKREKKTGFLRGTHWGRLVKLGLGMVP
jgi:hypothetical protein